MPPRLSRLLRFALWPHDPVAVTVLLSAMILAILAVVINSFQK